MENEEVLVEEPKQEEQEEKNVQPDVIEEIKREIMARIDEVEKRIAKVEADEAKDEEGGGYEDEEIGY